MPADFLKTSTFQMFLDEAMRQNACQAVELFLHDHIPVKNSQLHAIPATIQSDGLTGLKKLIENQKGKNTNSENRSFWEFLWDVVLEYPGPEFSLRAFLQRQPQVAVLLQEESDASDKKGKKRIRKANKAIVDELMEHVLQIYFEHFNCHYFYKTRQGALG